MQINNNNYYASETWKKWAKTRQHIVAADMKILKKNSKKKTAKWRQVKQSEKDCNSDK